MVLVAPGGTGKSTACQVIGPGLGYLSDETVGIRRDGSIAPHPKPISVRTGRPGTAKDELDPHELGLCLPDTPPWVAGVLLLRRRPELARPLVVELDTLDALVELTPETSGFARTDRPLSWLAELLEHVGGARRVEYATAQDLTELVHEVTGR